jgi:hypothetical protein
MTYGSMPLVGKRLAPVATITSLPCAAPYLNDNIAVRWNGR